MTSYAKAQGETSVLAVLCHAAQCAVFAFYSTFGSEVTTCSLCKPPHTTAIGQCLQSLRCTCGYTDATASTCFMLSRATVIGIPPSEAGAEDDDRSSCTSIGESADEHIEQVVKQNLEYMTPVLTTLVSTAARFVFLIKLVLYIVCQLSGHCWGAYLQSASSMCS